jgi:hypothetical protein
MKRYIGLFIALLALGITPLQTAAQKRIPVIIELFTSEGCNTCPPADKYLQTLVREQPIDGVEIIPLQEHVDYWNRHGWTDPFSSAQFSNRQGYYATFFKLSAIFTPQLIVDGTRQLNGKTGTAPITEAAKGFKGSIDLKIEKEEADKLSLRVKVSDLPKISDADKTVALLAITENNLKSEVSAGENKGSVFKHMAVTRYMKNIGEITDKEMSFSVDLPLDAGWKRNDLSAVVFLQEIGSRRIVGATKISLKN